MRDEGDLILGNYPLGVTLLSVDCQPASIHHPGKGAFPDGDGEDVVVKVKK